MKKVKDMKIGERGYIPPCYNVEVKSELGHLDYYFTIDHWLVLRFSENYPVNPEKTAEYPVEIKRLDPLTYSVKLGEEEFLLTDGDKAEICILREPVVKKWYGFSPMDIINFKDRMREETRGLRIDYIDGVEIRHNFNEWDAIRWKMEVGLGLPPSEIERENKRLKRHTLSLGEEEIRIFHNLSEKDAEKWKEFGKS